MPATDRRIVTLFSSDWLMNFRIFSPRTIDEFRDIFPKTNFESTTKCRNSSVFPPRIRGKIFSDLFTATDYQISQVSAADLRISFILQQIGTIHTCFWLKNFVIFTHDVMTGWQISKYFHAANWKNLGYFPTKFAHVNHISRKWMAKFKIFFLWQRDNWRQSMSKKLY